MTTQYIFAPHPHVSLPIVGETAEFPVHRIFCVGRNYAEHAIEMGHAPTKDEPFFFDKPSACIARSGQTLPFPPGTQDLHHEVELVVALKSGGHKISETNAMDCVYGYAVGLDMTRRDLQAKAKKDGKPWDFSKAFENSAIIGAITPANQLPAIGSQSISLTVNGSTRQNSNVSQLIFSIAELIAYLSNYYTLQAGDILFTGTPAGVSAIHAGDHLIGKIDGLSDVKVTYASE